MSKKFKLTQETKKIGKATFCQIRALRNFGSVKRGYSGGWIEKEDTLSHEGECWISNNVYISGNARVAGGARILGSGRISGDAKIFS